MITKPDLIAVYKRYGFTLVRDVAKDQALVFTLKTGYFDNAEIVKLSPSAKTDSLFREFSDAGYACTVREAKSPVMAEEELFNGFFSVASTRQKVLDSYERFSKELVKPYGDGAKYEYIRGRYQIDGKDGDLTPPEEVLSRIDEDRPILFLIEAAAGFGKTCTAQEICRLLAEHPRRLPLYAELSRNRQAKIFRYILLDEIDRTFPLLNSGLVQAEIKSGRIAAILDGFDELLRKKGEADDYKSKEPMLETVSELLSGHSKIVITTRKTILFDGDEFHQWLERHANDFSVIRIRIQEPKIGDWLISDRVEALQRAGLDINAIANPVLLSYIRCINDVEFNKVVMDPEGIVQSYFRYMLDRESERQDLRMTVDDQSKVLSQIASDMIAKGYTAEQREYIVKFLLDSLGDLIEVARGKYPSANRPSREEIANKLASHALLDRSAADSGKIGFVNEFALGNYVADNIVSSPGWLGDDLRFIEPAVRSYIPRTNSSRRQLYDGLRESLPFLDIGARVEITAKLIGELPNNLAGGVIEGFELSGLEIGNDKIRSVQFGEIVFRRCKFIKNSLDSVTFLNCRFFDCEVVGDSSPGSVFVLGCDSSPDISLSLTSSQCDEFNEEEDRAQIIRRALLKKFWPVGDSVVHKPSRPVYKPIKFLFQPFDDFSTEELYRNVDFLFKQGILIEKSRSSLVTLNFDNLERAYGIFGEQGE